MSNKVDYSVHPNNPAAQPFNVGARPNKTKKHSWWSVTSSTYWRNARKPKKDKAEKAE